MGIIRTEKQQQYKWIKNIYYTYSQQQHQRRRWEKEWKRKNCVWNKIPRGICNFFFTLIRWLWKFEVFWHIFRWFSQTIDDFTQFGVLTLNYPSSVGQLFKRQMAERLINYAKSYSPKTSPVHAQILRLSFISCTSPLLNSNNSNKTIN